MWSFLFLVAACGYKKAAFQEDAATAICTWVEDCELMDVLGYADPSECETDMTDRYVDESCLYDKKAAEDCVSEINALGCDADLESATSCALACPVP